MFELAFHEKNGLYCPSCGHKKDTATLMEELQGFEKTLVGIEDEREKKVKRMVNFKELTFCPHCKIQMKDIFGIKNSQPIKKLCVYDIEFSPKDFDEFVAIVTHYNILDYDGDKYMDPSLKKDMELKANL